MSIIGLIVVLAALVFGLGYYLGWFKLSSNCTAGKSNIVLTVDKDKMSTDKQTAQDKAHELSHRAKDAVSTSSSADNK
jgi:hypothetical protein